MPTRGVSEVGLCCVRVLGYTLLEDYRCLVYDLNLFFARDLTFSIRGQKCSKGLIGVT